VEEVEMPVDRKRLLELGLPILRVERDRIEKEIEQIQAELKGLSKSAKQARLKKRKRGARKVTAQHKKNDVQKDEKILGGPTEARQAEENREIISPHLLNHVRKKSARLLAF